MKDESKAIEPNGVSGKLDTSAQPILAVDVEKYQSWLDEPGLSDEQKVEFLQALWSIVVAFVELGFGVHPLQEVCGQANQEEEDRLHATFNGVTSPDTDKTRSAESSIVADLKVK